MMKKMMSLPRKMVREGGQSLVELAISLMVIMLLLSGAVDFGMALFSYVAIRDAAQEGAFYGALEPADEPGIRARVCATSTHPVDLSEFCADPADPRIEVDWTDPTNKCEGQDGTGLSNGILVTVRYDYPIIMPLIGAVLGGQTIPLTAQVTDTILYPRCE